MSEFEIIEGYISVYEVLNRFGYPYPGKTWKKLLAEHRDTLPPHTRKQFTMADGRKGRLRPAILLKDFDQLVRHLDRIDFEKEQPTFQPQLEQDLLGVLVAAFRDLDPQVGFELDDLRFDLYFALPRVAVLFGSPRRSVQTQQNLQSLFRRVEEEQQVVCVQLDPYGADFHLGEAFWLLRQTFDGQGFLMAVQREGRLVPLSAVR